MFSTTHAILRLREKAPIFQRRVGGTYDFAKASAKEGQGDDMKTPYCYVVPIADSAKPPEGGNMVAQLVTETFATIVCVDNAPDPRNGPGANADALLRQARFEIMNAFLNWRPDNQGGPIRYARSMHLHMTQARIWHHFEWTATYYVCRTKEVANEDQLEFESIFDDIRPLTEINETFARAHVDGSEDGTIEQIAFTKDD